MVIKKIRIRNFRSISDETIELANLCVFVGDNDAGKSNVLRALNLFFNGRTDSYYQFNFASDFNHNAVIPKKKAKEIVIEITIIPPTNYTGAQEIIWRKVWRKDGKLDSDYLKYIDGTEFQTRSKIPSWLSRIKFKYVPAVKGTDYFSELLGELHDCLSTTVESQIKNAAASFTNEINQHTKAISENIRKRLNIESSIQLPRNLKSLFVNLDFQSNSKPLSLNQRGDGIKARHIPIILRYLADQDNHLRERGSPIFTHIWGYEEPENNLELSRAYYLADEFHEYAQNVQIILTTHSPAFYQSQRDDTKLYYLSKLSHDKDTIFESINDTSRCDELMGVMPIIAPYVNGIMNKYNQLKKDADALAKGPQAKPTLFLEGKSDLLIIKKALNIFNPSLMNQIEIQAETGAGANWVHDKLIAWLHNRLSVKAAGIFDDDTSGNDAKNKVDNTEKYRQSSSRNVKTFKLKGSKFINEIQRKISLAISIEEIVDISVWQYAKEKNWLEQRYELAKDNPKLSQDISKSIAQVLDELGFTEEQLLLIKNRIKNDCKMEFAKYVSSMRIADAKSALLNFEKLVDDLGSHFKIESKDLTATSDLFLES